MLQNPSAVVSVVVLSYNQGQFVEQALQSVLAQGREGVELILADDASTDDSISRMEAWAAQHWPDAKRVYQPLNAGNCRAFNAALVVASGEFVIDLAADDQLTPERFTKQVAALQAMPAAPFCYGDARYVDAEGQVLYQHSRRFFKGGVGPEGDVFERLFRGHFICPSSVMFRTEALRALGGYNERLAFEDFDIWMRMARTGPVVYVPQVVSLHRVVCGSLSTQFTRRQNPKLLRSVAVIGRKAGTMAVNNAERAAINWWLGYHSLLAIRAGMWFTARGVLAARVAGFGNWRLFSVTCLVRSAKWLRLF